MASDLPNPPTVPLAEKDLRAIARALADPRRQQILECIGRTTCSVACSQLLEQQDVTPATLSHHMKELETAGLIEVRREGKFANYALRRDVLNAYIQHLANI